MSSEEGAAQPTVAVAVSSSAAARSQSRKLKYSERSTASHSTLDETDSVVDEEQPALG